MVSVGSYELTAILDHCRSLLDASHEVRSTANVRAFKAATAKRHWEGAFKIDFTNRFDAESDDLTARSRGLKEEADAWAEVWASAVNEENERRRQEAVDAVSDARGFGEKFGDFWIGHDDSGDQVRTVEPVSVPTAETRYAPTGGLEAF